MEKLSRPINHIFYPAHGGNRHAVLKGLGVPDEHVIDFSASVNPLGPSPMALSALDDLSRLVSEYPESDSFIFSEKISGYLKIPSVWILVTNGSTELIHLLPRLLEPGKEALILNPCFSEYERALCLNRIRVHSMTYDAHRSFQMSPERVINYLHHHPSVEMLVLGHPNNPTGHLWNEKSLEAVVQHCKSHKIILAVDETFIEFCGETVSALKWMRNNQYLVVVRSMTKFFGLAGVRLGYGVMHQDLRVRLKKYQVPWSVNALAQAMGIAALADREYPLKTREMVREQRQYLFSELNTLKDVRVFPSQANFLLFQLSGGHTETAPQLYMNLMKDGLLVRNCGNFSGLDTSYFRVAVRGPRENQTLVSRMKAHL